MWIRKLVIVLALLLVFYWVKCQLGFNLINNISWEKICPLLNVLQRYERTIPVAPGILLEDDFEGLLALRPWGGIWSRQTGAARSALFRETGGNTVFEVVNTAPGDWTVRQFDRFLAAAGQVIHIQCRIRTFSGAEGAVSAVAMAPDGAVLDWGVGRIASRVEGWAELLGDLVVPSGVKYLRFRLEGAGMGRVWFDNVKVEVLQHSSRAVK